MKIASLALLLPAFVFGQQGGRDILIFREIPNEALHHIEREEEAADQVDSLSLMEIQENDASLLPWLGEEVITDRFTSDFECTGAGSYEEFEDVFAYEMPPASKKGHYAPTREKVAAERRRLFNRPKVVESPSSADSGKDLVGQAAGK